jgi:hypothetical protein
VSFGLFSNFIRGDRLRGSRLTTRKVIRGMKRVQNHLGIASSSVAESDISEREQEWVKEWMLESGTIVEEQESSGTVEMEIQHSMLSTPIRQPDESTIPIYRRSPLGRQNDRPSFQQVTEHASWPGNIGPSQPKRQGLTSPRKITIPNGRDVIRAKFGVS